MGGITTILVSCPYTWFSSAAGQFVTLRVHCTLAIYIVNIALFYAAKIYIAHNAAFGPTEV